MRKSRLYGTGPIRFIVPAAPIGYDPRNNSPNTRNCFPASKSLSFRPTENQRFDLDFDQTGISPLKANTLVFLAWNCLGADLRATLKDMYATALQATRRKVLQFKPDDMKSRFHISLTVYPLRS
jgi:hypothetical protein